MNYLTIANDLIVKWVIECHQRSLNQAHPTSHTHTHTLGEKERYLFKSIVHDWISHCKVVSRRINAWYVYINNVIMIPKLANRKYEQNISFD